MPESKDRPSPPRDTGSGSRRLRRSRRRVLPILTVLVLLILVGTAGAAGWLFRTDGGRAWLKDTALEAINGASPVIVRLGALEGDLPFEARLVDLSVADADGVWLAADRIALAWDPWGLLDRRLTVTRLEALALSVERMPVFPPSDPDPTQDDAPFDPRLLGFVTLNELDLDGISLGASVAGEPVIFDVDGHLIAEGDGYDPQAIDLRLAVRRIDGPPTAITATAQMSGPDFDRVALTLEGRIEPLSTRVPGVVADLLPHPLDLTVRGTYALESARLTLDQATLADDGGVTLVASGIVEPSPLSVETDAHLDLTRLDRLKPVLGGLSPSGSGRLSVSGVRLDDTLAVSGDATLALSDAALGIQQVDALLGPDPTLKGRVAFDPDTGLSVKALDLDGTDIQATGAVSMPASFKTLSAKLSADVANLGPLTGGAVSGPVTLDATGSGALGNPDVTATVRSAEISVAEQTWTDVTVQANADTVASGASGALDVKGTGPGGPVTVAATYALPSYAKAELRDVKVQGSGVAVTGSATTDFATLLSQGRLTLSVDDAGGLAAWGAPPMTGGLSADVTLSAEEGRQRATVTAQGRSLALSDADVSTGSMALDLTADDLLGTPALAGTVSSEGGAAGPLDWDRLTVRVDGPISGLSATAELSGSGPTGPLTLTTAVRLQAGGGAAPTVALDRLSLETGGHTVTLRQSATLTLERGAQVDRLALAVDDGTLTLQGGMTGQSLDVAARAEALPLALADLVAPDLGLSGRLDLTVEASGRLPNPSGRVTLSVRDVALAANDTVPALAAEASARLDSGRLTAEATVSGFADQPARAEADLPLTLGGGAPIPADQPLSARVDWEGPVARLWELLPLVEHRLAGDLTLHAAVSGTLAAPSIEADARLAKGTYEHLTAGTLVEDLTVTATAAGTDQVSMSLSGTDGGNGRLEGEGDVELTERGPVGTVSARLKDAMLVRRDEVKARADADLTLDLEGDRGALSGWVETREVRVSLAAGGGASVQTLDAVEIDDPDTSAMTALERALASSSDDDDGGGDATLPVALDVTVRMPNRVYVTGQGLESEWQGRLEVGGTAAAPRVTGTIDIKRGTIDVVGRTLSIETGNIKFTGGRPINPLLEVIALYETADLEGRVGVRGPARDPEIVLESSPARPRDEVLSHILFDKRSGELSAVQTVQLARALAGLTGVGGDSQGLGLLDTVRQATGLDVLRVGESGEGGSPGVEAGAYLGEDVYVGVEQGIDPGAGGVNVEVDLGAGFRVESKARRSGAGEVGVMWRRDY